jgi:hypothetical protein
LPPVASLRLPSKPRVAGSSPAGRASSQSIRELATPASPQARRGSRSSPRAGTSPAGRASRLRPFTIQGTRGAASSLARRLRASLVVAGVVVARIEIHTVLPSLSFSDELDRAESAIARLPECLASLCPQHTPLFAAPLSVQRRLSRRTTTHSDRRCSACAAPARVLEAATAGASLGRCAPSAGSWRQGAEARRAKEACRARHVLAELR